MNIYPPTRSAFIIVACLALFATSIASGQRQTAPLLKVRVVESYPHDAGAFCQGLAIEDGTLYEGTGRYGSSSVRQVELKTGKVLASQSLSQKYFGEGITILGDRIYQLTWQEKTCVVYKKKTITPIGKYSYRGEGWGLADDGKALYMSDGTSTIRVLDSNFKIKKRLRVKDGRHSIAKLNELEFFEGYLYANVWYKDVIAKIDPKTGKIVAWLDCSRVYPTRRDREHVLNGIAYDAKSGKIFITGKNWPRLYEIEIVDDKKSTSP